VRGGSLLRTRAHLGVHGLLGYHGIWAHPMADISLIPVEARRSGHVEFLWQLLLERGRNPQMNISHVRMPSLREHLAYVDDHPYRAWYLISLAETWIGTVSVSKRNEIGVHIVPEHRGHGWGRKAVKRIIGMITPLPGVPGEIPGFFVANVNPANVASIALFESLGAKHIQSTYRLPQPGEDHGEGQSAPRED